YGQSYGQGSMAGGWGQSGYGQGGGHGQGGSFGQSGSQHDQDWDPDYRHWREQQVRKLDDDYRRWRSERAEKFGTDFQSWREKLSSSGSGRTRSQGGSGGSYSLKHALHVRGS